ncbi:hypothetical protein [Nocardioides sambongensis]|uniref:hypothetical protein n=1 Tax=Nocardioides sambongensis TaxID=2589074 RepID=UPI00112B5CC6|nr:hypothetical protein [Nocardioides sambongensis]
MEPLIRAEATAVGDLQMENELLRYEVAHLRARLAAADEARTAAQRTLERLREKQAPSAALDEARTDLMWLLGRLDRSPAGPLLRRYGGFRTLRDKYLGEPDG